MHKAHGRNKSGFIVKVCVVLVLALTVSLFASCKEAPEPEPAPPPPPPVADHTDAFYSILSMENKNTNNISLGKIRDFYAGGSLAALALKLAQNPSNIDVSVSASIDDSVFSGDEEYAEFISKFLRDASLDVKGNFDPKNDGVSANAAVSLSGQKLASADFLIEGGELFGVRSAELYPTYLTLSYADLMKIISDATHSAIASQLLSGGMFSLIGKCAGLMQITNVSQDKLKEIGKPFIDKSRDALTRENITLEENVAVEGVGGVKFKKVSAALANDDLKQMLTALAQAAKENGPLIELIKDKYAVVYDLLSELADAGFDTDPLTYGLPPSDDVEGAIQSTFAAFEAMLGSSGGLPVNAAALDLYMDGTVLKCVHIGVWTDGSNSSGDAPASGAGLPAEPAPMSSADYFKTAGEPSYSIWFKSYENEDGLRTDSFTASYKIADGAYNKITVLSELRADKSGGEDKIYILLDGPAFYGEFPNFIINYVWGASVKKFSLSAFLPQSGGGAKALASLRGEISGDAAGDYYTFNAAIGLNDPEAAGYGGLQYARAPDSVQRADETDNANTDAAAGAAVPEEMESELGRISSYTVGVRCDGRLVVGQADVPSFEGEDTYMLVQDSFYDGTFESIFNEFFTNLIRFASANRQLLSLYGFPGF